MRSRVGGPKIMSPWGLMAQGIAAGTVGCAIAAATGVPIFKVKRRLLIANLSLFTRFMFPTRSVCGGTRIFWGANGYSACRTVVCCGGDVVPSARLYLGNNITIYSLHSQRKNRAVHLQRQRHCGVFRKQVLHALMKGLLWSSRSTRGPRNSKTVPYDLLYLCTEPPVKVYLQSAAFSKQSVCCERILCIILQ